MARRRMNQREAPPRAGDMPTVPIQVHRASTSFDSPSTEIRQPRVSGPWVQGTRRAITQGFGAWTRFSTKLVRKWGWYPKVEPYAGYGTDDYARLVCRTVMAPGGSRSGELMRGIRGMLAVPAAGVRVKIEIDGVPVNQVQIGVSEVYDPYDSSRKTSSQYAMSDSAGYLDLVAERGNTPGIHLVSYQVARRRRVTSELFVVPAGAKVGIITDVDDTIMVTQAPSPVKAAYNLLLLNPKKRSTVPGMSALFTRLADMMPDAPFFYLSTSPWNVESSIRNFIAEQGYPAGPLLLRDLDPRPKTFIPSGVEHKLEFAEQLMEDFPDMKFILIGDDGQKDPVTYATIARRHPGRVLAIAIRELSPHESSALAEVAGLTATQPMPVTDVPVFTGTTGANIMKTMLPYLRNELGIK
ncbi:phosphatase domain-containing protein [Bifidobacterium sp. ESL0745]|uniref:App1 family protein n=1 Tax=Bifidobacterium sp. ESL0745 TaxID=2983226 RepID=UPI0023F70E5E|nr:phosphatase domain-containing protein [Bifidobacterium sp. ESL0745]MDF7665567.1 DUF2183 domain-containing protein [Bifidobacterium sp. ESL0745]